MYLIKQIENSQWPFLVSQMYAVKVVIDIKVKYCVISAQRWPKIKPLANLKFIPQDF